MTLLFNLLTICSICFYVPENSLSCFSFQCIHIHVTTYKAVQMYIPNNKTGTLKVLGLEPVSSQSKTPLHPNCNSVEQHILAVSMWVVKIKFWYLLNQEIAFSANTQRTTLKKSGMKCRPTLAFKSQQCQPHCTKY